LAYSRRIPSIEEHHRRALAETVRTAKEPLQAFASDGSLPSLSTPIQVPKPLFLAPDGRDVEAVNNETTDARRSTPGPTGEDIDGESSGAKIGQAVWRPAGTASRSTAGTALGRGRRQTPPLPLAFSSSFECGNLLSARLVQTNSVPEASGAAALHLEYELEMESDTQTTGRTQWFYFACYNSLPCTVTFRIVNFRKKRSLYRCGMQPHVCSQHDGGVNWDATACREVKYTPNGRKSNAGGTMFTLSFRYEFRRTKDTVFFAGHAPYSYSMLRSFFTSLCHHPDTREHVRLTSLCRSVAGIKVPLLLVSSDLPDVCRGADPGSAAGDGGQARETLLEEVYQKPAVVLIARQHPGETVSSYVMAGLIRFLVGDSPAAKELRDRFCFHIVPMVNVDGVIYGNARCTLTGYDPNRCWLSPDPVAHPIVYGLREYLNTTQNRCGVSLFLDLHGHSQRTAAFFYGVCPEEVRSALFPKLASLATRDVDFDGCRWRFGKAHEKTARAVAYSLCGIFNSFTLETSFFAQRVPDYVIRKTQAVEEEERVRLLREVLFVPDRTESIGSAVGHAMAMFFEAMDVLSRSGTPTSQQTLAMLEGEALRPEEAEQKQPETFNESNARSSPWLNYRDLRRVTASGVLADLEARGSTVFDLARSEGEDGPDSDSDCEDDGHSTSSARPPASKPAAKLLSRQSTRFSASDDDLSPASDGKAKCRRRSTGSKRDGKRSQGAARCRPVHNAAIRSSLGRGSTARKGDDQSRPGSRCRQILNRVTSKYLTSSKTFQEACKDMDAAKEETLTVGKDEGANGRAGDNSPAEGSAGCLPLSGSAGHLSSPTLRTPSTVKPPETLELLLDKESGSSKAACPIWAAALRSSRARCEQENMMASWQGSDIEESPAATSRTAPSQSMEDMADLNSIGAWRKWRPPTRRARILQSASTGSLHQQSPALSCIALQAVEDHAAIGQGLRLTGSTFALDQISSSGVLPRLSTSTSAGHLNVTVAPPVAPTASGSTPSPFAVVAMGAAACSGVRTGHQSRGRAATAATSAVPAASSSVSAGVRPMGQLRAASSCGQILNSGQHLCLKLARGCDQSGEKVAQPPEQRIWERWVVRE